MANRSIKAGITLSCAISADQGASCSCGGCGGLFAASDCCRLLRSTSHRFRTKFLTHASSDRFAEFLAHADSGWFADAGLYSDPEPQSYAYSDVSDENHSQPDSHSNSDRHSNTHAIVTRPEYHSNAYANSNACGCVAGRSDGCPSSLFYIVPKTCRLLRVAVQGTCTKCALFFIAAGGTEIDLHLQSLLNHLGRNAKKANLVHLRFLPFASARRLPDPVRFSEFIPVSMFDIEHSL